MEKVLVTGANGLLGANIVRQLSAKGYLVRAMLRKGSDKLSLKGAKFELFEGEITRPGDVAKAVSGCGYIIHSAARTSQSPTKPEAFVKINIEATSNLIESCKRFKVKRFVFVSTANCFTNGTINQPGNESSGFMPWLKKSGYAYSKFLAQENVLREVKENSFPAIVVNPTFMIGPHDSKPSSGKLLLYGHKNRIVFYPPGGKSFVDVELAAKSICNALIKGKVGESYLLAGENLTYKKFFKKIGKISGKRKTLVPIPLFILSALGNISDILGLFSILLPLDSVNARLLSLDNYFSNKKAIGQLGLGKTEINNSIARALNWFDKNRI